MFTSNKLTYRLASFIILLSLTLSGLQPISVSAQAMNDFKRLVKAKSDPASFIGPKSGSALAAPVTAGALIHLPDPVVTETAVPTETALPTETSVLTETAIPLETPIPADTPTPTEITPNNISSLDAPMILTATTWYVATTGLDTNSCTATGSPCLTINGAIGKAADNDTIKVATGTYTSNSSEVVLINISIALSGGWNSTFTTQNGMSTIDSQNSRKGINVNCCLITASLDRFIIKNGHTAGGGGAGIHNNNGTLTVSNSSINGNSDTANWDGGGIYNANYNSILTLINTTVSNNSTGGQGGGIYNGGTLTLKNATVSNNSASYGGGIYNYSQQTMQIGNSILSANISGNGPDCWSNSIAFVSLGNNIISATTGCTVTAVSGDQFNVNSQLGDFLPNQGYQPLLLGSPAINAGNPANCLSTDQRGVIRVGICDIGAYEYTNPGSAASIFIVSGSGQRTAPGFAFSKPLKAVVLDSQGNPVPSVNVTFTAPASGVSGIFASSNTNTASVLTDGGGVATTSAFTANNLLGAYSIAGSSLGLTTVNFNLENVAWYVATTGSDANTCTSVASPCLTIDGAISKATAGDTILVAGGTYTSVSGFVVNINKNIKLSGGWNPAFTSRNTPTIIDGQNAHGGIAIGNTAPTVATIEYFRVSNGNSCSGGGVFNYGSLTLRNSTISNNNGGDIGCAGGGGIWSYGTLIINNTTLSGNFSRGGGGIHLSGGSADLNNVTLTNNLSTYQGGGGIYVESGTLTIRNSIVASNMATVGAPDCNGTLTSSGYNLIGNNSGCILNPTTGDLVGTAVSPINAGLTPLQDNGGPTLTHALMAGSPAINAGNPAVPGSGGAACLATDQRGTSRPVSTACDMGAFEGQVAAVFVNISGNAGVAGAKLNYMDGTPKTVTADGSGNYSLPVLLGWSGTVTPSKFGYAFTPVNKTYNNLVANQTSQNYTASPALYIQDPSFEASFLSNTYWGQFSTNSIPVCNVDPNNGCGNFSTAAPRTGVNWVWFGGIDFTQPGMISPEIGDVYQNVIFPSCSATLQFYFWIGAAQPGSDANDYFAAKVDGATVFLANATQTGSYPGYTLVSVDVSAFATGTVHTVEFYSNISDQFVTFNLDDVSLIPGGNCTISGNAGAAGTTLSYTDGTPKTVIADGSGNYSINVLYGWSGTVTPSKAGYTFSPVNRTYANVVSNQVVQNYTAIANPVISGNVGVAGVTLSYTDGVAKTTTSLANGNYSFQVSNHWSGTVTPSHICFTFNPLNKPYSNITANQSGQDYVPTFNGASGCANINVSIGGVMQGKFGLPAHGSTRASFGGVNNGPVQIHDTNAVSLIGAERVIYAVNGVNTSFSEMLALPNSQLGTTYWLPWYNNVDLDTQLRFGNVSGLTATVHVFIAGNEVTPLSGITLLAGASTRVSYTGVNSGSVQIVSDQNIVAAERVIYKVNSSNTSFSEMLALPNSQLDTTYWLPWYNNVDLDTQLRLGNVSGSIATVHIFIGGSEVTPVSGITLLSGASARVSYGGVNNGPVQIVSDQNIVAAERVIYKVNGTNTSFSEMLALPNSQLSMTYWLPWYNNVDLDTQLRFAAP